MRVRWLPLAALAVMASGLVGCNTVPQTEYDALQTRCNELSDQNADLAVQLEHSQGRVGQLLSELSQAQSRAGRAESRVDQLQSQVAARQAAPSREPTASDGSGRVLATRPVSLGSDTLFDPGKAALKDSGRRTVAELAGKIRSEYPRGTIRVVGHTDADKISKSKWKDNLDLSAQRAMAVTRELIAAGVDPERIETVAVGEHHPVASNRTSAGKAKNRRVDVEIFK